MTTVTKNPTETTKTSSSSVQTNPLGVRKSIREDLRENRVDSRVIVNDLKPKEYLSSIRRKDQDHLFVERKDKIISCTQRKIKCATPKTPVNWPNPNLGRILKEYPLVRLRPRGPLCGYVAKILQQKTDSSFRILSEAQNLLVGTVLQSDFYYYACSPYLRGRAGLLLVSRKPSLGATRLILTQLLRVSSNFPWKRLESIIRQGPGINNSLYH